MVKKTFTAINAGMNRDLSESKVGESVAWENHNIRILARENGTALSVTNERGTKDIALTGSGGPVIGTIIGWNVLNTHIILFTTNTVESQQIDYIYRIDKSGDTYTNNLLYSGSLDFSVDNPIESVVYYESENVQKIYWVDGRNVLRFMNFMASETERNTWENRTGIFDSNMAVVPSVSVSVDKDNTGNPRQNGVIQYFLTYYNKYGQESAIAWISDLIYLSPFGIGGEADGVNNNKITLTITGLDYRFKRFKIYSILRTALDGTVVANLVADYEIGTVTIGSITTARTAIVVDDAAHLTTVDVQSLLYLGSLPVKPGTLTYKDQTLFLGDLRSVKKDISDIITEIKSERLSPSSGDIALSFDNYTAEEREIPISPVNTVYPYKNTLEYPARKTKTFKYKEKYRFALKFGYADGTETDPIWIGDLENSSKYPTIVNNKLLPVSVRAALSSSFIGLLTNSGITTAQLMMAEATYSDRSVLAQGIVNPTVFNVYERNQGGLYVIPSWITRPRGGSIAYKHFSPIHSCDSSTGEIACSYWSSDSSDRTYSLRYPYYTGAVPPSSATSGTTCVMLTFRIKYDQAAAIGGHYYNIVILSLRGWMTITEPTAADKESLFEFVFDTPERQEEFNNIVREALAEDVNWAREYMVYDDNRKFAIQTIYSGTFDTDRKINVDDATSYAYDAFKSVLTEHLGYSESTDPSMIPEYSTFQTWCHAARSAKGYYVYVNTNTQTYRESSTSWYTAVNGLGGSYADESRWTDTEDQDYTEDDGVDADNASQARFRRSMMYVDENIITLNSPEIEYGAVYPDNADYKFRIVGIAPLNSMITDYTVDATMGHLAGENLVKKDFSVTPTEVSTSTNKIEQPGIISWPLWKENKLKSSIELTKRTAADLKWDESEIRYYWLHMWERSGVITGYNTPADIDTTTSNSAISVTVDDNINRYSYLRRKVFANMYVSRHTIYTTGTYSTTPDALRIFNSDSSKFTEMIVGGNNPATIYYDGIIDTLLFPDKNTKYPIVNSTVDKVRGNKYFSESAGAYLLLTDDSVRIQYATKPHAVISLNTSFGNSNSVTQEILPSLRDRDDVVAPPTTSADSPAKFPWEIGGKAIGNGKYTLAQSKAADSAVSSSSWVTDLKGAVSEFTKYLFIGEIYRSFTGITDTRYGGATEEAAANCRYIVCGPKVNITNANLGIYLYGSGDTYYERYDCLRTVPFSGDSVNNVIDIASVMLETHINIDGRSDKYRNMKELASIDVEKYGQLNPVYSQQDNFRATRQLDVDYAQDSFRSHITWALDKADMSDVDAWSHVTIANSLKLDPDYGICRALHRYKNDIIAFQDKAISEILFNNRTLLSTDSGVPVELANSGKVTGKSYITNNYGCTNKWSIVEGKQSLYFVDSINKAFCSITVANNGRMQLANLSQALGFSAWFKRINNIEPYAPSNTGTIRSFFDSVNCDVYLLRKRSGSEISAGDVYPTLVFNENLGKFSSFFDYDGLGFLVNIDDKLVTSHISSGTNVLYHMNEGLFCNFFGTQYGFGVTYRIAPEFQKDKIWSNIDYRADFYRVLNSSGVTTVNEHNLISGGEVYIEPDSISNKASTYQANETFTNIQVWNEYQHTIETPPNLQKKFRIWRYTVPRAAKNAATNIYGLDRIRNPWIYAKFEKTYDTTNRPAERQDLMQLHDMEVTYYE